MNKSNLKLRKSLSYLLFPAMTIFTLSPGLSYGGVVYVGGDKKPTANNTTSVVTVHHTSKPGSATVKAINKANARKNDVNAKPNDDKPSPSTSNAANYTLNLSAEVNTQTGQLDVNPPGASLSLPGVNDIGINIGICNSTQPDKHLFGMAYNWRWNIPYIDTTTKPYSVLHLDSSQNYQISSFKAIDSHHESYDTGLLYNPTKTITFKKLDDEKQLPAEFGSQLKYRYIVISDSGSHTYFDSTGKVIAEDDVWGNHVLYSYNNNDLPVISPNEADSGLRLSKVTENFAGGNSASLYVAADVSGTYNNQNVTLTYPPVNDPDSGYDGKVFKIQYNITPTCMTVTNIYGRTVTLKSKRLSNNNLAVYEIDYPTGARAEYSYNGHIYTAQGSLPAIDAVKIYPDSSGCTAATEAHYTYGTDTSFEGPGPYESGKDTLIELHNGYTYTTTVTQTRKPDSKGNNRDIISSQTFNFLHLPIESKITYQGNIKSDTNTVYAGENSGDKTFTRRYDQLRCNDEQPADVATTLDGGSMPMNEVVTTYDDYSQPLSITQTIKKKDPDSNGFTTVSKIVKTFDYYPYSPASSSNSDPSYHQLKTSKVTDTTTYTDAQGKTQTRTTTTETDNHLADSGDNAGKYFDYSTVTRTTSGGGQNATPLTESRKTATTVDSCGRMLTSSYSDPDANGSANGPSSTKMTTAYSLDGTLLTTTKTDALGNTSIQKTDIITGQKIYEKDPVGNITTYKYADNGLVQTVKYPDGSTKTVDSSDSSSKIIKIDYSNGREVVKTFDGLMRLLNETDSFCPGAYQGYVVQNTYDNMLGSGKNPSSSIDMYAHKTTYTYDWKGRPSYSTDYLNNTTHVVYDDSGLMSTTYINDIPVRITHYDNNGKVVSEEDETSGTGNTTPVSAVAYNGAHQQIYNCLALNNGTSNGAYVPLMDTTTTLGINTQPVEVDLSAYQEGANGTVVHAASKSKRDVFGDLENKQIYFDQADQSQHIILDTPWYPGGKIISEQKKYDNDGRLTLLTKADGSAQMTYTYNADGKVATMTDFAGNTFTYTYDSMGRETEMSSSNGIDKKTTYFTPGNKGAKGYFEGKVESNSITFPDGQSDTISYQYDNRGNLVAKAMNGKTMKMEYDGFNRITSMTDFANDKTDYTYNETPDFKAQNSGVAGNSMMKVANDHGSVTYHYFTLSDGPLFGYGSTVKETDYSNNMKVVYHYYGENTGSNAAAKMKDPKLKSIETFAAPASGETTGKLISGSYYTYDDQDRIQSITQRSETDTSVNGNNVKVYSYNSMNQLTEEHLYYAGGVGFMGGDFQVTQYWYDVNGNITSRVTVDLKKHQVTSNAYTYNSIDELMSLDETQPDGTKITKTFDYDVNGNMLHIYVNGKVQQTFTYDALNDLVKYQNADTGADAIYTYNAEGLRKSKQVNYNA